MASVRDSAEVKLVGFEQGVNVKTLEQVRGFTRARFHPLANPKVVFNDKSDKKPSVTLRVRDIPVDPGDGQYNLHIESFKGSDYDIKIRVVGNYGSKTTLSVTNNVTKQEFDDGINGNLHNKNFNIIDALGKTVTVTLDFSATRNTRNSPTSWSMYLSNIDNTNDTTVREGLASNIYDILSQISSDEDLNIEVSIENYIITINQSNPGAKGDTSTVGTLITDGFIELPNFTSGKIGLLRTLNTGDLNHPRDINAFALGLKDPPGYYVGEVDSRGNDAGGNAVPYTDNINSDAQKIKRITFDINNIINFQAGSGITSRIIQDDTLLLMQETKGVSAIESGIGKKIFQNGLDPKGLLTGSFGLENWKLTSSEVNDFVYHDLFTETKSFDVSSREAVISVNQPDLDIQFLNKDVNLNFLEISYDTIKENISLDRLYDTITNKKIQFFITSDGNLAKSFRKRVLPDGTTNILINPFISVYGSNPNKALEIRKKIFQEIFANALKEVSKKSPITLEFIEDIGNDEFSIRVKENKARLTYFSSYSPKKSNPNQRDFFINFVGSFTEWDRDDWYIQFRDGEKDAKYVFFEFDRSRYSPKNISYGNFRRYLIGTAGTETVQDIKGRIYDAFYLAGENLDLDITPSMKNASARIKVTNGSWGHMTNAVDDRITLTSAKGESITYTIVHGGRGGSKAIRTGEKIKLGSKISPNDVITDPNSPAIGTIAVNILDTATRRDVLNELSVAINRTSSSLFKASGVDPVQNEAQYLHLKQVSSGEGGNNEIVKNGFSILEIVGFEKADDYIASNSLKLRNSSNRGLPAIVKAANEPRILPSSFMAVEENIHTLDDFSDPVVTVELRDGDSQESYYTKVNHDLEIRSFGFNKRTSDLKHFEDLSLHGPKFDINAEYSSTLTIDPVFFVNADSTVRFPVQVNNLGSVFGFEYDGVIELLDLREAMMGRSTTEEPIRGIRGELGGEYFYSSIRKEASIISNEINFEKSQNVAFFDNCPNISKSMDAPSALNLTFSDPAEAIGRNNVFYSKVPGVIFKNNSKIQPYIDTEERIFQSNPLNGNNPETNEMDLLVLTLQEMGVVNNMITTDGENLGGENFRRKAGFDYSSPHPGTDSIVFSGLRYV